MKIKQKGGISVIDGGEDTEKISYCPNCLEYNVYRPLRERIYLPEQLGSRGEKPRDHDQFKQCHDCGLIVPIYQAKYESEIQGFTNTSENPFDESRDQVTGIGNKIPNSKFSKERQRLIKKANKETDSEIRREILKGNLVEDLTDY